MVPVLIRPAMAGNGSTVMGADLCSRCLMSTAEISGKVQGTVPFNAGKPSWMSFQSQWLVHGHDTVE